MEFSILLPIFNKPKTVLNTLQWWGKQAEKKTRKKIRRGQRGLPSGSLNKNVLIGSYIFMFSHQEVKLFGSIIRIERECVSSVRLPGPLSLCLFLSLSLSFSLSMSLCLSATHTHTLDCQGIELSEKYLPSCLPTWHQDTTYDHNRITFETVVQLKLNVFFYISCCGHCFSLQE